MSPTHVPIRSVLTCIAVIAFSLCGDVPAAQADDRSIITLVPADATVAYIAKPYDEPAPEHAATSQPGTPPKPTVSIAAIIDFLNAGGLIPNEGQVFADIASALPLLGRFEHAMVLLDVSSRVIRTKADPGDPDGGELSLRLKELQCAIIFRTNGEHRLVLQQLNRIINRYTNKEVARLETQRASGYKYQRLTDERMPGWAVWEWGRLDDFFVLTFGAGAFEKIAATYKGESATLHDAEWFRQAMVKTKGDSAIVQVFIAFAQLGQQLGVAAQGRHSRVIKAIAADNMTYDLWTVGREGRALRCYRCYQREGKDIVHRYSDPANYPVRHRGIIPPDAERYGIITVPTQWLVDNLPRSWIAAKAESTVEKWTRIWERLEQETGVDINGNLVNHLGKTVVFFDYPPHPLNVPFTYTIAIEIDERPPVKMAIDTLLSTWSRYLDREAERKGTTLVRVKVLQSDDDIWYLQAGILGPALKVTDRYIVISWSPQALRDAMEFIRPEAESASQE